MMKLTEPQELWEDMRVFSILSEAVIAARVAWMVEEGIPALSLHLRTRRMIGEDDDNRD